MDSYIYEIYFAEITWMMGGLVMTILLKKNGIVYLRFIFCRNTFHGEFGLESR